MNNEMMVERLRDQWLEPEDAKVIYTCEWCGEDIQDGEEYYELQEECICESCFEEFASGCKKTAGEE